jgi:hypothetical protein
MVGEPVLRGHGDAVAARRAEAASVATTAIVVFSGLSSASRAASAAICSAGRGEPELGDQMGHPGRPVAGSTTLPAAS